MCAWLISFSLFSQAQTYSPRHQKRMYLSISSGILVSRPTIRNSLWLSSSGQGGASAGMTFHYTMQGGVRVYRNYYVTLSRKHIERNIRLYQLDPYKAGLLTGSGYIWHRTGKEYAIGIMGDYNMKKKWNVLWGFEYIFEYATGSRKDYFNKMGITRSINEQAPFAFSQRRRGEIRAGVSYNVGKGFLISLEPSYSLYLRDLKRGITTPDKINIHSYCISLKTAVKL